MVTHLQSGQSLMSEVYITYRPDRERIKEIHQAFGPEYQKRVLPVAGKAAMEKIMVRTSFYLPKSSDVLSCFIKFPKIYMIAESKRGDPETRSIR